MEDNVSTMSTEDLLDATMAPEVTDDIESAFSAESYDWEIPTGKLNADGKPVYLRVKVRDPQKTELPTQYLQTVTTKGQEEATVGLWQACVMEPVALKNPANIKRTSTAFRSTLTYRLLTLVGVNGDFFGALASMGSRLAPRPAATSSTKSPASTVSTPVPPPALQPTSSTTPTVSPGEEGLRSALPS